MSNRSWAVSIFLAILLPLMLVNSTLNISTQEDQLRAITRPFEFDYVSWTLDALILKAGQLAANVPLFLDAARQRNMVRQYLDVVGQMNTVTDRIQQTYTDPSISDPAKAASADLQKQKELQRQLNQIGPLAETVLQQQVSYVLAELGLATAGQPLPPLLYHVTPLPMALIISPRKVIQQDYDISLLPAISLDQIVKIEQTAEQLLDVSALVVPVGGIGVYPTMVMSSTDLPWLLEVICHEWTHNYLTVRPLGLNYTTNDALRTMNETTANIAGKEISAAVLRMFYPELVPPPPPRTAIGIAQSGGQNPTGFDFRNEMHVTRVEVDRLLAEGLITQAEQYMETRRQLFWDNGYAIRRLNQAYFAFYGAYADVPGGEAGNDPIGPAVTALRQQSATLKVFLSRISQMTDFAQLQAAIQIR